MGAILQTLTVAVTLLIVGLTCVVIGVVGLMWKTGHERRRMEKAANEVTTRVGSASIGASDWAGGRGDSRVR